MIKILGFKKSKEMTRVSPKEEKRNLNRVKNLLFSRLINGEREKVIFVLCEKFRRLRYEDIEEIYSDGCLVLWKKMNDENFKLKEETLVAFLIKIGNDILFGNRIVKKIWCFWFSLFIILCKYFIINKNISLMICS